MTLLEIFLSKWMQTLFAKCLQTRNYL